MRHSTRLRPAPLDYCIPCAVIDALEPRRLLAVVDASPGPDEIIIQKIAAEAAVRVVINGNERFVVDDVIVVNAHGGDDTVTFGFYSPGPTPSNDPDITIDLGAGDDTFEHTPFSPQDAHPTILGGSGNDLMLVDHTGDPDFQGITLDSVGSEFRAVLRSLRVTYQGFEMLEYYGSDSSDLVQLHDKPPSLRVEVNGQGENDSFIVGGGDLDDSGILSDTTLIGGNGRDSIQFDDRLDAEGETESYTFDLFTLAKGSSSLIYSSFEVQTLRAANGGSPGVLNTVNVNAISGQTEDTTIIGGMDRSCTVNLTTGNLVNLGGAVTLNLPAPLDRVNLNDQSATGVVDYTFDADRFERLSSGRVVNFAGVESMTLNAGASDSNFAVRGTPAGMFLAVNAGAGSDILLIGNGNVDADLLGQVVMNGGPISDVDEVIIANDTNTDLAPQTLIATSFTDGATHSFIFIDSIRIIQGPGGSNINVNSTAVVTTIVGGDGDDHVRVGNGNYSANIPAQLHFNGGNGDDSIVYDDASTTGDDEYLFAAGNAFDKTTPPAAATFTNSVEHKTLEAGSGNNIIDVFAGSQDLHVHANAGNDQVYVSDMVTGAVTVNTGSETTPGGDLLSVNADSTGSGDEPVTVIIDQNDAVGGLSVLRNGTLRIANNAVLRKAAGLFNLLGTIDVSGGALFGALPAFQMRTYLSRGYNGGAWNGTSASGAINSSLAAASPALDAVGHGLGSQIAIDSIGGFTIAPTDVLVRHTLAGDADLDQQVNLADFNRLATSFGLTGRVWTDGDSNYDGIVNLADFNALAGNFGQAVSASILGIRRIGPLLDRLHLELTELT